MNFTITGRHFDITPAIHDYAKNKISRLLKHMNSICNVSVILFIDNAREKQVRQKAILTIHVKGKDLRVEAASANMYTSIDQLADKLEQPLNKLKETQSEFTRETIRSGDDVI